MTSPSNNTLPHYSWHIHVPYSHNNSHGWSLNHVEMMKILTILEAKSVHHCCLWIICAHALWSLHLHSGGLIPLVHETYYTSFSIIRDFLPNPGRILPALTFSGSQPLNVNAGRIWQKIANYRKAQMFVISTYCIVIMTSDLRTTRTTSAFLI